MKFQFATLIAILLGLAQADFGSDVSAAASAANRLKGSVDNWNSNKGLLGALGIQGYFPTLSNAVVAVSQDAGSINAAQIDAAGVNTFVTNVVGLLNSLVEKAQDFSSVGATSIVAGDISSLTGPAGGIASSLVSALQPDCNKFNSLTSALSALSSGFSKAASVYNIQPPSFPEAKCGN